MLHGVFRASLSKVCARIGVADLFIGDGIWRHHAWEMSNPGYEKGTGGIPRISFATPSRSLLADRCRRRRRQRGTWTLLGSIALLGTAELRMEKEYLAKVLTFSNCPKMMPLVEDLPRI